MVRSQPRRRANARYASRPRGFSRRLVDYALAAAILGLLILLAARLDGVETRRVVGQAAVQDGDSVSLGGERIRLQGIDAPEFDQLCHAAGADYACGRQSREALIRAIGGQEIVCAGWRRDRYDRLLAACSAGGLDLNRSQVEAGWALAYGDFEAEEKAARRNRAGMWAGTFDQPGDWRARHGGLEEGGHDALAAILDWLRQILRFS